MKPTTFAGAARPFIDVARLPAGDLLPIIPHNATLSANTHVGEHNRGKVPGIFLRDKTWGGRTGTWATVPLTQEEIRAAGLMPTHNVGLRAASFPAIDIDVASEAARDLIEENIVLNFGPAPTRVRPGSPRSLMVFRLAGSVPATKKHLKFELGDGLTHAIDFLGLGQQYLIAGTHPSGTEYGWREGAELTAWGVDGLYPVTAADLDSFFQGLPGIIEAAGGRVLNVTTSRFRDGDKEGAGFAVKDLEPMCDPQDALAALRGIPNTEAVLPNRSDLVSVLSAFRAALGRRCEEFKGEAEAWATAHGWCEPEYFEKIWGSLEFSRVGPDHLFLAARKAGWKGGGRMDFANAAPVEEAEEVISQVQAAHDDEQAALATAAKLLTYWPEKQEWIVRASGEKLSHGGLNHHAIGMNVAPAGKSGVLSAASKLRNSRLVQDIVGITYAPGKDRVFTWKWNGKQGAHFNRWRSGTPADIPASVTEADVRPWLDHLEWLFPNGAEREEYIKWMGYILRNPGKKVRWAPVVLGAQGVGKDLSIKPLVYGLGHDNVMEVSPAILMERWTPYYERQLCIVQEMSRQTKMEIYERLKADISGTGADTLMVEDKGEKIFPIPNTLAYVFMTNHPDAFTITPDDRRFFVLKAEPSKKRDNEYYDALLAWYDAGGLAKACRYLLDYDLTGFRAEGPPMMTAAKQEMIALSLGAFGSWLFGQLEEGGMYEGRTVISAQELQALADDPNVPQRVRAKFGPNVAGNALRMAGWESHGSQIRTPDKRKHRVWLKTSDLSELSGSLLGQILARETGAKAEFSVVEKTA